MKIDNRPASHPINLAAVRLPRIVVLGPDEEIVAKPRHRHDEHDSTPEPSITAAMLWATALLVYLGTLIAVANQLSTLATLAFVGLGSPVVVLAMLLAELVTRDARR